MGPTVFPYHIAHLWFVNVRLREGVHGRFLHLLKNICIRGDFNGYTIPGFKLLLQEARQIYFAHETNTLGVFPVGGGKAMLSGDLSQVMLVKVSYGKKSLR